MMKNIRLSRAAALTICAVLAMPATAVAASEVNVYSSRQEVLIRPLLDAFTEETGIVVNMVSGSADALLERLKREGINSPADILLTVDVGRLIRAREAGALRAVSSETLVQAIPAQYRDPEGYWFGLSVRARVIFYAPERVSAGALSDIEGLAGPEWRDRICVRSSSNVYNQSLLASLIAHNGAEAAEDWARKVTANMARTPQGGDRDQIRAVAAGQCDVAIANTYYYARMLGSEQAGDREVAAKVRLFWPNQGTDGNAGRGAHVNISGAGVTASAKNPDSAVAFLEFLTGEEAQRMYAEVVMEYPVRPGVAPSEVVGSFGSFKADDLNLATLAVHSAEALRIFDRAGWR